MESADPDNTQIQVQSAVELCDYDAQTIWDQVQRLVGPEISSMVRHMLRQPALPVTVDDLAGLDQLDADD